MDRQAMMDLAQRIARAPNNDARLHELVTLTPDATLARIGLAHRSTVLSTVLATSGVFLVGAVIGAGAALLLAPTSGEELQAKIRKTSRRAAKTTQQAAEAVEERVVEAREETAAVGATAAASPSNGRRNNAHA